MKSSRLTGLMYLGGLAAATLGTYQMAGMAMALVVGGVALAVTAAVLFIGG